MAKPIMLTVDDDVTVSQAISRDLRARYARDYRIVRATSGAEALGVVEELAARDQPVAVIVSDHRMPQMTGIELLERARPLVPEAKLVLLTAYADTDEHGHTFDPRTAATSAFNVVEEISVRYGASLGYSRRHRGRDARCSGATRWKGFDMLGEAGNHALTADVSGVVEVTLLGRFAVSCGGSPVVGLGGRRVQELLAYLLVHADRSVPREVVADCLWGDHGVDLRKLLRQSLWHLQQAISRVQQAPIVRVDDGIISVTSAPWLQVDVRRLDEAQTRAHGIDGAQLAPDVRSLLVRAVDGYHGDFLPTCYENWSIVERERCRAIYLALLDKLINHAEAHGEFDDGLRFGEMVLSHDAASERTHRSMMRLRHLSGDRTGAIRQFERCRDALQDELGVAPSAVTIEQVTMIRNGDRARPRPRPAADVHRTSDGDGHGPDLDDRTRLAVDHLGRVHHALADATMHAERALTSLTSLAGDGE